MQDGSAGIPEVLEPETVTPPVALTARIVAAYLSNNVMAIADLPTVIQSVHHALVGTTAPAPTPAVEKPVPAIAIRKSVTPDYIVCLEDGKKLKMLKRHIFSTYGLTPDAYRTKWDLPPDYPMTAPNYAAQRSVLAKSAGLGRKPVPAVEVTPTKRPGRPKKAVV